METEGQELLHKILGERGRTLISDAYTLYLPHNSMLDTFLVSITYTDAATEFQSSPGSPDLSLQNDLEE